MDNNIFSVEDINHDEPTNERVYRYIYNAIIDLRLKPGAKLIELQIANELQVSRTPVKAALQRLEYENLVVRPFGKSPQVASIDYADCAAMLEARKGIEGTAAYYAASRITEDELDELWEILQRIKIGEDVHSPEESSKTDAEFHQLIVNASRNKYIIDAYMLIQSSLHRYRLYILRQLNIREQREYEHHLPVYYALKNRSGILAREEIIASLENMREAMRFI